MNQSEVQLAQRLQVIEDRLILASLPLLIVCLLLWAVASAFPEVAGVVNLSITILVVLVFCVVVIQLVGTAWRWVNLAGSSRTGDAEMYGVGVAFTGILILLGLFVLVETIVHAGEFTSYRTFLIVGLLIVLVLQYRAIIVRYLQKNGQEG